MTKVGIRRALGALGAVLSLALFASPAQADCSALQGHDLLLCQHIESSLAAQKEKDAECTDQCFVLDKASFGGAVQGTMTFEVSGTVRAKKETKIPLFGPPTQVRLDKVTVNGAPATLAFEDDSFVLFAKPGAFTVRGEMHLGTELALTIKGPLNGLEAKLSKGRLVEGESLSGLSSQTIHFDPMNGETVQAKVPQTFRLARSLRIGKEIGFTYRITVSQGPDIGAVTLPLKYGERVREVSGSTGWKQEDGTLTLPVAGHDADLTVTGTLPALKSFTVDERSAYEWWLVEHDPDHRISLAGEGRLVENAQSPIPPQLPTARTVLVQRGQHFDIDARPLVRGEALAALARSERRFVAITASGEAIIDDVLSYENNGLDHLVFTPAGTPMYVSTDGNAEPIFHTKEGGKELLVPLGTGGHQLRTQSVSQVKLRSVAGLVQVPMHALPITTGASTVTIGLPNHLRPIAIFGGDRTKWIFATVDAVALGLGTLAALMAFRTRRQRILGVVATTGLWLVSSTAFALVASALLVVGAVFVASRFLRGMRLFVASGVLVAVGLLGARWAVLTVNDEPARDMITEDVRIPQPDSARPATSAIRSAESQTPLSLSVPRSDVYVEVGRQLITEKQPFEPRVLYLTTHALAAIKLAWLVVVAALGWQFRDRLRWVKERAVERLRKRPEVPVAPKRPLTFEEQAQAMFSSPIPAPMSTPMGAPVGASSPVPDGG